MLLLYYVCFLSCLQILARVTADNVGVVSIFSTVNILFLASTILDRVLWLACHVGIELGEIKLAAGPSLLAVSFVHPLHVLARLIRTLSPFFASHVLCQASWRPLHTGHSYLSYVQVL